MPAHHTITYIRPDKEGIATLYSRAIPNLPIYLSSLIILIVLLSEDPVSAVIDGRHHYFHLLVGCRGNVRVQDGS